MKDNKGDSDWLTHGLVKITGQLMVTFTGGLAFPDFHVSEEPAKKLVDIKIWIHRITAKQLSKLIN